MGRNNQYYSQKTHSVTIASTDGKISRTLRDFDGDNCISWEFLNADKVQVVEGFDESRLSFATGSAGQISVTLKPTSPDVGFLNKCIKDQAKGKPSLFNVEITTGVDEVHRLRFAGVKKEGGETGGPTMTGRKYIFVGESLDEEEDEGSLV